MTINTVQRPGPTCPGCGHEMDDEDMLSCHDADLFDLAQEEGTACIMCPICDAEYWVQGGYMPHYTSAFCEDQL